MHADNLCPCAIVLSDRHLSWCWVRFSPPGREAVCTAASTRKRTHTHTCTYMCAHTHKHTHSYQHIHTHFFLWFLWNFFHKPADVACISPSVSAMACIPCVYVTANIFSVSISLLFCIHFFGSAFLLDFFFFFFFFFFVLWEHFKIIQIHLMFIPILLFHLLQVTGQPGVHWAGQQHTKAWSKHRGQQSAREHW